MNLQDTKQRFGIIGNNPLLERAIDIARQVAPTDLNVLINGESGTGKEVFPQIIHQNSARKHGQYIAVNCGAIPEGTIDSELFGHEKGSFTGAHEARKGYFEVADGGTIFLDEVGELPLTTQARLLRVLETGEYIRVGSSKVQKTNVRVVAATNINFTTAIEKGKFREDLYYRLNTVPINLPPLRERKDDIYLLFRKFASDFATKYRMPAVKLSPDAEHALVSYYWPGNIRQLKNITEQISIIEKERDINLESLLQYLPNYQTNTLPILTHNPGSGPGADMSERDLLYKVLFDMKKDLNDLKKVVHDIVQAGGGSLSNLSSDDSQGVERLYNSESNFPVVTGMGEHKVHSPIIVKDTVNGYTQPIVVEESLSLQNKEIDMIKKALKKHKGKRKYASQELGISERTLYRKINEYNIEE
ncbi:MAG: sigma-54-dependent Fis family transcriptional regulator [Bacteroidota bacterium]|jgi:transcriptional regulator with PAS, ATPase and Fis domain|nr:sigma-54-dependent Fis family transcriptional regulator [Bacteroidota bacterium]